MTAQHKQENMIEMLIPHNGKELTAHKKIAYMHMIGFPLNSIFFLVLSYVKEKNAFLCPLIG